MADFKRTKEVEQLKSYIGKGKVNVVAGLRRRCNKIYTSDRFLYNLKINSGCHAQYII